MLKNKKSGFTLIELLVVISIIALLSSIVLTSLQGARNKAIDSSIAQDMRQFQIAVELSTDTNGSFPTTTLLDNKNINLADNNNNTTSWIDDLSLFTKKAEAASDTLCNNFDSIAQKLVNAKFLSKIPVHPKNNRSAGICYKAFRASDDSYFTAFAPLIGKSNTNSKRTGFILVKSGTVDSVIGTVYTATKGAGDARGYPANISDGSPGSISVVADEILGVTKGASVAYSGGGSISEPEAPPVEPTTYTLSVSTGELDGGWLEISPEKSSYNEGESVIITAHPYDGYYISYWYDGSYGYISGCEPGDESCTISMDSNRTVIQDFRF